jgi:hypothetical protein
MAITNKVSKPALSPEWQVAATDLSGDGAAGTSGITLCSKAGAQAVSLADGAYNGQMAIIIANGTGANTVTPASILGNSATTVVDTKETGVFVWYSDGGSNEGWACVQGVAGS